MRDLKRAIVKCIDQIAEDHIGEHGFEELTGHWYPLNWEDCINIAIEEFNADVKDWLECFGYYDIHDSHVEIIQRFAETVNWKMIKDYADEI
jgi:hypothetical protein